jgi:glucan 1,3-beta-glucosidase
MFLAKTFNSGFWTDPHKYQNTYLDSHYYHVFEEVPRALSPRQHIAFVCTNERRDVVSCCYDDYPVNLIPSDGIQRMVGEWSVATDTLPATMLKYMLESIAKTGIAADFDRTLSPERQGFLKHFAQAQMVAYESADVGTSSAWFYWNFKMEGGGFAEWDYLRGINEGWIPRIPSSDTPSTQVYGTCYDILFRTNDTMDIIHEYPDPATPGIWIGAPIDDDVVLSHGQSLLPRGSRVPITPIRHGHTPHWIWALFTVALFVLVWKLAKWKKRRKTQYMRIDSEVGISA